MCESEKKLLTVAQRLVLELPQGPSFTNSITKATLHQERTIAIEYVIEAKAQAIYMPREDASRGNHAFVTKQKSVFQGS
jgi:hypothetical protein